MTSAYDIARQYTGQREGYANNLLNRFLNGDTAGMTSAEYAWCSRFVKQAAAKAGVDVSKATDMAKSWLDVGQPVNKPSVGDVVVLSRGNPNSPYGHVGFYEGTNPDGSVRILSGNHNNAVASGAYPANRILGYRRLAPDGVTRENVAMNGAISGGRPIGSEGDPNAPDANPNGGDVDGIVKSVFGNTEGGTGGGLFGSLGGVKLSSGADTLQMAQAAAEPAPAPQFQHTPLDPARLREVVARRPQLGFRSA